MAAKAKAVQALGKFASCDVSYAVLLNSITKLCTICALWHNMTDMSL